MKHTPFEHRIVHQTDDNQYGDKGNHSEDQSSGGKGYCDENGKKDTEGFHANNISENSHKQRSKRKENH